MIESKYLEENNSIIKHLRQIPTLKPFDDDDLSRLLQFSKIRKFSKSEKIFGEGTYDTFIYFLIYGQVRIEKNGSELTILNRRGDIFGEMGALNGSARSATAYADEKAVCLACDTAEIERLSGGDKIAFCYVLYRVYADVLADRLRATTAELIKSKGGNWKFW